jgi:hypothetical protein
MLSCDGQERGNKPGNTKKTHLYLTDSKEWLGVIYAAIVLLESVIYASHNPKVAGSNPAPATIYGLTNPISTH